MQGNSKYLRWSPLFTCCCVFVILSSTVIAVPVRPRRMVRETFSFDSINSNTISNATCFNDGIEVQKSSVKCEIKTGCKLIQKTGECCPEYQCDCNLDDRTYENGEKIVSHNPCRRCVCKGGEITCNDVSCYIRDDCKPRYLKGVCCPQYDNCPPIDDVKIPAAKEAVESKTSKNDVVISLATTTAGNAAQNSDKNSMQLANENPLGIKIKEITKPEEIRITDDKPKPYNPFKTTTTTTSTTTTTVPSTTATESPSTEEVTKLTGEEVSTSYSTSTIASTSTENPKDSVTEDTNQSSGVHESRDYMDDGVPSEASSIAPPSKASTDGEVEAPLLLFGADSNSIGDDTGNKSVRQTTENGTSVEFDASSELNFDAFSSTTENAYESSTSSDVLATSTENRGEETDLVAATPKNVVVVRVVGGKTESFHISGTDGLQRVEELDVLSSTTESSHEDSDFGRFSSEFSSEPTVNSVESADRKSSKELSTESSSTPSSIEVFDATVIDSVEITKKLDSTLNLNESSTENLTNNSIEVSTPGTTENSSENSSESLLFGEQVYGTVFFSPDEKTTASSSSEEPFETVYFGSTEDGSSSTEGYESSSTFETNSSSESNFASTTLAPASVTEPSSAPKSTSTEAFVESTSRFSYEDEEITIAENPEYPYIPDDLSLHNKDVEEEEKRRLPSKVVEENVSSTAGPSSDESKDEFKGEELSTQGPSLEEIKESHKSDIIEMRAPGEPLLIPEWERTTTTTTVSTVEKIVSEESTTLGPRETATKANEINKTAIFEAAVMGTKTNKSEALTTIETLPNDVDSEEKFGRKEPTTERPTTKGYTDVDDSEEGSASSAQSEFDSSSGDGVSPKDDAESIKLNASGGEDETKMKMYSFFESLAMPNSFLNHLRFVDKENKARGWSTLN